jgi:hypothetical protein
LEPKVIVNEKRKQICITALRVAAAVYVQDAASCKTHPRLVEQFTRQAGEANELADLMESRGVEEALS